MALVSELLWWGLDDGLPPDSAMQRGHAVPRLSGSRWLRAVAGGRMRVLSPVPRRASV